MKYFREKASMRQKVNVASSSGKGKVNVILEEDDNPVLT